MILRKRSIRFWLSKSGYLVFGALFCWMVLPRVIHNFRTEGKEITPAEHMVINPRSPGEKITIPAGEKSIVIFWATWCGPCKLEMNRLKSSVENGSIPDRSIIAISASEPVWKIQDFLAQNPYPFTFVHAPSLAEEIGALATPTTVFLEGRKIQSMSTGISFFGIWKAELFL